MTTTASATPEMLPGSTAFAVAGYSTDAPDVPVTILTPPTMLDDTEVIAVRFDAPDEGRGLEAGEAQIISTFYLVPREEAGR